ncbi:hypothetical protein D6792_01000 [Candidatus Parcubacteria bacterium]|nr:MAG: hypothetical protein D6792_01000 [Candidatus Parcubacteria bacterium]GIW68995.1 MAG: phospho-N-acetylmuramoyl-pentapeptide-transferase [Candidatus Parcubacteria bacterium]
MDSFALRLLVPAVTAFLVGIALTPLVTHFLYRYRAWKKKGGKGKGMGGGDTEEFDRLHKEREVRVPRMGGIVVWGSVLLTTLFFWLIASIDNNDGVARFQYLSREQTWLPLSALMFGAFVGLVDDILTVLPNKGWGLPLRARLALVSLFGAGVGWWFWSKLEVDAISWLGNNVISLGVLFIPFVIIIALALYASGVIDGIDGLAGGVFASVYGAYGIIALHNAQYDLAAFCFAVLGALLAFLWFNIPPARFYMTETGIMALTMTLTVVVLMTDTLGEGKGVLALPIIALPLVLTVASNIIQVASKRLRKGAKIFRIAPIHHHFEAIGWPPYKVTMRYWVFSILSAFVGVLVAIGV